MWLKLSGVIGDLGVIRPLETRNTMRAELRWQTGRISEAISKMQEKILPFEEAELTEDDHARPFLLSATFSLQQPLFLPLQDWA